MEEISDAEQATSNRNTAIVVLVLLAMAGVIIYLFPNGITISGSQEVASAVDPHTAMPLGPSSEGASPPLGGKKLTCLTDGSLDTLKDFIIQRAADDMDTSGANFAHVGEALVLDSVFDEEGSTDSIHRCSVMLRFVPTEHISSETVQKVVELVNRRIESKGGAHVPTIDERVFDEAGLQLQYKVKRRLDAEGTAIQADLDDGTLLAVSAVILASMS